jgi:hypothetical protein
MSRRKAREFSNKTQEYLRERVAYMCSNPLCRQLTVKADFTDITQVRSGKASHIHSVGKKGPRYDPNIIDKQCASFENGIWLCDKCSREVDDNNSQYSADTLRIWKREAEEYVRELVTQDSRLRQLQTMMQHVLTTLRVLSAVPGPGPHRDLTFSPPGEIDVTRMLTEAELLLFERGFRKEADTIQVIRDELEVIYKEINANPPREHLNISAWKDAMIHSVMVNVMRFREESYGRYRTVESTMVSNRIAELQRDGFTIRTCTTLHQAALAN